MQFFFGAVITPNICLFFIEYEWSERSLHEDDHHILKGKGEIYGREKSK